MNGSESIETLRQYLEERLDDIERQIAAIREQSELRHVGSLYSSSSDGPGAELGRRITAEEMGQALIWQSEAVAWMTKDDPMQAEAAIRAALRVNPDSAEARFTLGWILHETGRHAEAEALYRLTLERAPHHVGAWFNLGNLLTRFRQDKEAVAAWRQAADLGHEEAERRCTAALQRVVDEVGPLTAQPEPRRGAFNVDAFAPLSANILPEQQAGVRFDRTTTLLYGYERLKQSFWRRAGVLVLVLLVGVLLMQLWWMLFH
ncbi:MAG: tetratricopeptide repeat protein [Magnetococcales bacterium]|nr:tetratricopeptide repeat protein [Magnetococcales bacterium]